MMTELFLASFCINGLLGGALKFENGAVVFSTNKLTVPAEYRKLRMNFSDIEKAESGWLLFLPTVSLYMKDGRKYKFAVYARKRFLSRLDEHMNQAAI